MSAEEINAILPPGEIRYQLSLRDKKTDAVIYGLGWSTGPTVPDEKIVEAKNVLRDEARPAYVSVEEVIFVDYGHGFTGTRPAVPGRPPNKVYLEATQ